MQWIQVTNQINFDKPLKARRKNYTFRKIEGNFQVDKEGLEETTKSLRRFTGNLAR
jgi:hypothetical protein